MLTANQSLNLYHVLLKHFKNEADAKLVVTEIENTIDNKFVSANDKLASKSDIFEIKTEIQLFKTDNQKLRTEMEVMKVDIIKWVFTFFATIALMIIGLYVKK